MTIARPRNWVLILILGSLSTVSPFSIDMYLPAFSQMAAALHTDVAKIALSLSSYFVGLSIGQIFYGPLLDRYGRKRPLYAGLSLYLIASAGCVLSTTVEALIGSRFLQALGGCVAQVASVAMVRDFFPVKEGARVFSLLMLIIGVSPLLAPSAGGLVTTLLGWQWVFILLAIINAATLFVVYRYLPEGHTPDPTVSLRLGPTFRGFATIFREPQFYTFAGAGALSFSALFAYVAGSPIIFMDIFHLSAQTYGLIFAVLSVGFIGGSQINLLLLRHFRNDQIFKSALIAQAIVSAVFVAGTYAEVYGLAATIVLLFLFLSSVGLTYPNAAALSLAPFGHNAGRASALLGFMQIGMGALASAGVGIFDSGSSLPTIALFAISAFGGLAILLLGSRNVSRIIVGDEPDAAPLVH